MFLSKPRALSFTQILGPMLKRNVVARVSVFMLYFQGFMTWLHHSIETSLYSIWKWELLGINPVVDKHLVWGWVGGGGVAILSILHHVTETRKSYSHV